MTSRISGCFVMLEFIVLGQIPGTTIQLSFWQFIELTVLFGVLVFVWFEYRHKRSLREGLQDIINRLAL